MSQPENQSHVQTGRPEAAAVIWNWREPASDSSRDAAARNPRLVGTIQALVAAGFALAIYMFWSTTIGTVIFSIAAIILVSAIVSPTGLYRGIQGLFTALANATGRALTWIMLVPLFYLFFVPFGGVMRRGRHDQMKRYFEPEEATYWEPHKPFSAADHERQF